MRAFIGGQQRLDLDLVAGRELRHRADGQGHAIAGDANAQIGPRQIEGRWIGQRWRGRQKAEAGGEEQAKALHVTYGKGWSGRRGFQRPPLPYLSLP
jgi:hypothetical protein